MIKSDSETHIFNIMLRLAYPETILFNKLLTQKLLIHILDFIINGSKP